MKKYTILLSLMLLATLTSCKKEAGKEAENTSVSTKNTTASGTSETAMSGEYVLTDAAGKSVGAFSINPPKIQVGDKTYTAKEKEDKRKYYENGTLTYEVKIKEDGFKLRDASSKLLWKVKVYPDKLKISDNEENTNPYEIRNNEGKIVVKKNDADYSSVKIENAEVMIDGQKAYTFSKNLDSFAVGILSIKEIPIDQKLFILAEYLIQKK